MFEYLRKLREIRRKRKEIKKLIKKEEKQNIKLKKEISKSVEKIKQENLIKTLKSMDVDTLNFDKSGIKISTLKANGYKNVYQVSKLSIKKLQSLNGIGEKNARMIYKNCKTITSKLKENVNININADDKSQRNVKLVRDTYQLEKNNKNISRLKNTLKENDTTYKTLYKDANRLSNPFVMMFSSRERKEELYNEIDELEKFTNENYESKYNEVKENLEQTKKVSKEETWERFKQNSASTFATIDSLDIGVSTISKKYNGLPVELAEEIDRVNLNLDDLNVTLRPYQTFGTKYIVNQEKVLLGDEMGLGKTMQAIATMCHLHSEGKDKFLVVAPLSVLINWMREIKNNSTLTPIKCYGDDYEENFSLWKENGGVLVTTYETIKKLDDLELPVIDFMVCDEAHYVKNPNSQRTQSLVTVKQKALRILFMTGTPIENNVDEMCFLVKCLQSDVAKEIEKYRSIAQAEEFKRKLAPVYLRRVREDVLTELPELTEKEEWVTLNNEEIKAYKTSLKDKSFMAMRHVSWNVDLENSSKAQRLLEICDEAKENGRKILVFTYFKETINKVQELLHDRCLTPITGAVKASDRQMIVDQLSEAPAGTVLICQVLAGGVGLNIQSASVVVFCEPQLKPSMETQAIARSYRMGQANTVMVHRLLCDDTVDERIMEILKEKENIFDNFADESIIAEEKKNISEVDDIIKKEQERWNVE